MPAFPLAFPASMPGGHSDGNNVFWILFTPHLSTLIYFSSPFRKEQQCVHYWLARLIVQL